MKRCKACLLPETHETLSFDDKGICNICRGQERKEKINWEIKLKELDNIINEYKGKNSYDCIVPFSGGKDSTWTLYYLMKRYPDIKPLVVRFNHGFMRPTVKENSERVFAKLGVSVHDYKPNWKGVQKLMLQSFLEKGDFCWHCHTGIFAYPMQVAVKEKIPLIIWGEPSAEYTAYYSYDSPEEVNEERFNRFINLGINADDMMIRLGDEIDERDLDPYRYPRLQELKELNYRSICLGSYIPWDVKRQVKIIKGELDWKGDRVENVPKEYDYEKIECWMQGVRDYIKFIKRGYTRPSHLSAIDLRNKRITKEEAEMIIKEHEGRRPKSLDIFLEYLNINEEEFFNIAMEHTINPWQFNRKDYGEAEALEDMSNWEQKPGLMRETTERIMEACNGCNTCQ